MLRTVDLIATFYCVSVQVHSKRAVPIYCVCQISTVAQTKRVCALSFGATHYTCVVLYLDGWDELRSNRLQVSTLQRHISAMSLARTEIYFDGGSGFTGARADACDARRVPDVAAKPSRYSNKRRPASTRGERADVRFQKSIRRMVPGRCCCGVVRSTTALRSSPAGFFVNEAASSACYRTT